MPVENKTLKAEEIQVRPVLASEGTPGFYLADTDPTDWAHLVVGDDLRDDWY